MTISSHVLDISIGRPAAAVAVRLRRHQDDAWVEVFRGATNDDGRVPSLLPDGVTAGAGTYQLTFDVGAYFTARGLESFYSLVAIDFVIRDAASHYHVPLLVSPYDYSTYRGS
jgi:5-hydroxyisourate hydrolase